MGRLTQYFGYIGSEETPTARDIQFNYSHLTITQEIRNVRYLHRLAVNKAKPKKNKP